MLVLIAITNILALIVAQDCFEAGPSYEATEMLSMDAATGWCTLRGGQVVNPDHVDFVSAVTSTGLLDTFIWTDAKPKRTGLGKNRKKYFAYNKGMGVKAKKGNGKFLAFSAKNRGCLIAKTSSLGEIEFGRIQCLRQRKSICEMIETYRPQVQYTFYTKESFGMVIP